MSLHEQIENHHSLGCEWPLGLDVKQTPNAQDAFWPIPGLISCAGVTGSVGITRHARATQMAGLKSSHSHSSVAYSTLAQRSSFLFFVMYKQQITSICRCEACTCRLGVCAV